MKTIILPVNAPPAQARAPDPGAYGGAEGAGGFFRAFLSAQLAKGDFPSGPGKKTADALPDPMAALLISALLQGSIFFQGYTVTEGTTENATQASGDAAAPKGTGGDALAALQAFVSQNGAAGLRRLAQENPGFVPELRALLGQSGEDRPMAESEGEAVRALLSALEGADDIGTPPAPAMTQNAAQALNEIRRLFEGLLAGAYGASDAEDAETGRAPAQGASPVRDTGPAQDADPAHDAEAGPPARSTLPDAFAARGAEQALTEDGQAQLSEKAESEPSVKTAATDQKKDPVDFGFVLKAAHGGETAPAVAGNEGPDAPAAAARQAFDSIVEKITSMRNASQQEMEISLKPEFLGRVVIRLSMDGDALVAKIAASDPKVQDAFLAQANALQSSLAEQGLKDVRVVVTSAFVPDASLQQQAEGRAQERYGRGRRNAVVVDAAEPAASPSPLSAYEQVFRTGQINCLA